VNTVLITIIAAFEFGSSGGPAGAMLAGGAVADWRHGPCLNPALVDTGPGLAASASGCRPYGLEGLSWARTALHARRERLGVTVAAASLGLGRYRESDLQLVLSGEPARAVWFGVGAHALVLNPDGVDADATLALDAGGSLALGRLRLGAAALNLNGPRWRDGSEQPTRLSFSAAWLPVEQLLLAADVERTSAGEVVLAGMEFRLAPPVALRLGVGTAPLRYAGGLAVAVGPVGLDYAWQFHPQLKTTHLLGLLMTWY
jgi:hypothetical protein